MDKGQGLGGDALSLLQELPGLAKKAAAADGGPADILPGCLGKIPGELIFQQILRECRQLQRERTVGSSFSGLSASRRNTA